MIYDEYVLIYNKKTMQPLDIIRGDSYAWTKMSATDFNLSVHKLYSLDASYKRLHIFRRQIGLPV